MKISSYSVIVLLLAVLVQGCGSLIVGGGSPGGGSYSGSQTRADAAITSRINTRFVNDSLVRALDIRVSTNQGVVTLSGEVDSTAVAARAVELARTTSGVKRVVSRLSVNP
ncbi:MAG: BON domain-containing protein [Gammaproteobacteria bacterium]|nr:BON domain-containing protein [Gammaproteobacteria bacterium]MDH3559626.1 BON domain-containing protein [Gammaproteobacteria bacterium]